MRSHQLFRTIWFAGCCLILAACGGDSTAPKLTPVTVDTLLAELNDVAALGAPAMSMAGGVTAIAAPATQSCTYNSSNQRFVCAAVVANGLTINRYYQLLDASNAPLASFDVAKVAAIRNVTDVSGTTTDASTPGTLTITAHDDGTLSGLLTGTHTLNSSGTTTAALSGIGATVNMNMTQTITKLVLPKRGSKNQYPQSGTIAMTMSTGTAGAAGTVSITMTFNGTSTSTWTMTAGGITTTCTLDLAKPSSTPVCH